MGKQSHFGEMPVRRTVLVMLAAVSFLAAQGRRGGGAAAAPAEKPEEGIPVTNPLVIEKCGTCHAKDDKGNLSRISWERSDRGSGPGGDLDHAPGPRHLL